MRVSLMLRVTNQVFYAECHYAECCYAECHYAECRYVEWRYAECHDAILIHPKMKKFVCFISNLNSLGS